MRSGMSGTARQGTRARSWAIPSVSGTTRMPESSTARPSFSFCQSFAGIRPFSNRYTSSTTLLDGTRMTHPTLRWRSFAAERLRKAFRIPAGTRPLRGYQGRPTASEVSAREVAPHLAASIVDVLRGDVETLPDATQALTGTREHALPPQRLDERQDLFLLLLGKVQSLFSDQVPGRHRRLRPEVIVSSRCHGRRGESSRTPWRRSPGDRAG